MSMTIEEQATLEGLSMAVTALAESIDPTFRHGPETDKLVRYASETRRLAQQLASSVFTGNKDCQNNFAREMLDHLGYEPRVNGGILGDPVALGVMQAND